MFQQNVVYDTGVKAHFGWVNNDGMLRFSQADGDCPASGGFFSSGMVLLKNLSIFSKWEHNRHPKL